MIYYLVLYWRSCVRLEQHSN